MEPFESFAKDEIEQSIPSRFEKQVGRYPHRLANILYTSSSTVKAKAVTIVHHMVSSVETDELESLLKEAEEMSGSKTRLRTAFA